MVEPYRALRRVHPKRQIAGNVATLRDLDEYFGRAVRVPGRKATALTQAADQRQHSPTAEKVASAFSTTLADRGMFCDLLAQAPLNL